MKRILFVDDEKNILDGLRDLLRKYRNEMEMVFALGSEAAISELNKGPFDVIVSDMRMPGMDGATLLGKVKEEYPETARIILSGYADRHSIFRALPVAHQYLTKPCDADRLCNVIERACRLRSLLADESLRKLIGSIDRLPSLPALYQELTTAMASPDASSQSISRIVEQDSAMSAKILQLVNSACFGTTRHIAQIDRAISYLGMELIKNLVLTVHVFFTLGAASKVPGFSLIEEQPHALMTARVASQFFEDTEQSEYAFTAGLLHDIGKLVLSVSVPEQFAAVIKECTETGRSEAEVETEILGVTHAKVGAYLLGLWGLPYPIVEAVAFHHEPSALPEREFTLLSSTWLADALVDQHSGNIDGFDHSHLDGMDVGARLEHWTAVAHEEVRKSAGGGST